VFIVKNLGGTTVTLQDNYICLDIQAGESVDLEAIFSHEQLYYSSLPPTGALWTAINTATIVRRNDLDTITIPISDAFYDPVWRYAPDRGQWEALVGTVPIPSSTNRYVTEADFGYASTVQTVDDIPQTLYEIEAPENSIMLLQTWVTAARTTGGMGNIGDSDSFIRIGTIKNVGNVLSLKIEESAYTNGTKVRIRVRGALNNTISWSGKTRTQVQTF
jgi:hypothetical protein